MMPRAVLIDEKASAPDLLDGAQQSVAAAFAMATVMVCEDFHLYADEIRSDYAYALQTRLHEAQELLSRLSPKEVKR